MKIPFNKPSLVGRELHHIKEAVEIGQLAGDGTFTKKCQANLADMIGCKSVLLTHSCTAALEMAMLLLDIQPGDEVIMPSYTFVSTANAVVLRRGVPVFVDIRPDTLNLDENLIEAAITPRTRAILPVHYAGVPAAMAEISEIASSHRLEVVEDAAQALGSVYRDRSAGSFGGLSAFSFHETKNIISGEGGCLAINDEQYLERAEIIREKGTNRSRFFRGQTDKYTWVDVGSSFLPGELIASFLWGQLELCDDIQRKRLSFWRAYDQALRRFVPFGLGTPSTPHDCRPNGHMYYIVLPSAAQRDEIIRRMRDDGIMTPFHYVPLHSSPCGLKHGRVSGNMTHTNDLSSRLLRLPLFVGMEPFFDRIFDRLTHHLELSRH